MVIGWTVWQEGTGRRVPVSDSGAMVVMDLGVSYLRKPSLTSTRDNFHTFTFLSILFLQFFKLLRELKKTQVFL